MKKISRYYSQTSSFFRKIFYGRWTGTGMDTMDRMDMNGLLNGQWTMDNGQWMMGRDYVAPFRADSSIADPTEPASCILPLAAESIRASKGKHQSQPGRSRHFLNLHPAPCTLHPSQHR